MTKMYNNVKKYFEHKKGPLLVYTIFSKTYKHKYVKILIFSKKLCYNKIMDMVIPLSEVFLAAVVHASLQLQLGTLLLLYHASLGKHVKKKTKTLVSSYIAGIGTLVFLAVAATCFLFDRYFGKSLYTEEMVIVIGMLVALAVVIWTFYYKRGKSTELWLPRSVANFIDKRAKETNSNTEAFSLGVLTSLAEMPFTLVLFIVAANSILALPVLWQIIATVLYTVITIIPPVILRLAVRRGETIVDVQRWRVKNKTFLRVISGVGFVILGMFLFAFEVLV